MIYLDINQIRRQWRNALKLDPNITDDVAIEQQIAELEAANNCKIVGGYDAGGWHCIDGIEFPDEKSLMLFKLKWS